MRTRNILRWIHIIGAASIGTFIYAPWKDVLWFALLNQAIIIPALTITGLWMWKPMWFRLRKKA